MSVGEALAVVDDPGDEERAEEEVLSLEAAVLKATGVVRVEIAGDQLTVYHKVRKTDNQRQVVAHLVQLADQKAQTTVDPANVHLIYFPDADGFCGSHADMRLNNQGVHTESLEGNSALIVECRGKSRGEVLGLIGDAMRDNDYALDAPLELRP